jgi:hypothetical protein
MAPSSHERCGSRQRRNLPEPNHSTLANGDAVKLSARGAALLDALREDPRYRDLLTDPSGEHGDQR